MLFSILGIRVDNPRTDMDEIEDLFHENVAEDPGGSREIPTQPRREGQPFSRIFTGVCEVMVPLPNNDTTNPSPSRAEWMEWLRNNRTEFSGGGPQIANNSCSYITNIMATNYVNGRQNGALPITNRANEGLYNSLGSFTPYDSLTIVSQEATAGGAVAQIQLSTIMDRRNRQNNSRNVKETIDSGWPVAISIIRGNRLHAMLIIGYRYSFTERFDFDAEERLIGYSYEETQPTFIAIDPAYDPAHPDALVDVSENELNTQTNHIDAVGRQQ